MIEKHLESLVQRMGGGALQEACAYALLSGGKRLRPRLVYLVAHTLNPSAIVDEAAIGVECFHVASLIADDLPCMDNALQRRGKASVHRKYGEATALLASYALIAEGYHCIQKNATSHSLEACQYAIASASKNTGILGATGGQYFDLLAPEGRLEEMIILKTAALFELSCVLGWLFGGGSLQEIPFVEKAAQHFGTAFQIQDDIDDCLQDRPACNYAASFGVKEAKQRIAKELNGFQTCLNQISFPFPTFDQFLELTIDLKFV